MKFRKGISQMYYDEFPTHKPKQNMSNCCTHSNGIVYRNTKQSGILTGIKLLSDGHYKYGFE